MGRDSERGRWSAWDYVSVLGCALVAASWLLPWYRVDELAPRPVELPWGWLPPLLCALLAVPVVVEPWWAPARWLRPLPLLVGALLLGLAAALYAAPLAVNALVQQRLLPPVEAFAGELGAWTRLPLVGGEIARWQAFLLGLPDRVRVELLPGLVLLAGGAVLLVAASYARLVAPARGPSRDLPPIPTAGAGHVRPAVGGTPAAEAGPDGLLPHADERSQLGEHDASAVAVARCTKADFDQILAELAAFWGDGRTRPLHHPMLLYAFGDTAYVIRDHGRVVAYLFGLVAQTEPTAYVHLVGVRAGYRRRGLARRLYAYFIAAARHRGCRELKALTSPDNAASLAFHRALGMQPVAAAAAPSVGTHAMAARGEPAEPAANTPGPAAHGGPDPSGEPAVPVVRDYAGPGEDRVVLRLPLD